VNISEIFVANDSLAKVIYKKLTDSTDQTQTTKKSKKNKKPVVKPTFEELASQYTTREGYKEKKGLWGLLSESDNLLAKKGMALSIGGISEPFSFENGFSIIKLNGKEPPRIKKYEECGPELSSKFQEYETKRLEQIWTDSLRKAFGAVVFEGKLKNAFLFYK
jgi:parvulin-like peptidyl-prolyl isomerase